jgi:hypothetical protein
MVNIDRSVLEQEVLNAGKAEETARYAFVSAQNDLFKLWLSGVAREDNKFQAAEYTFAEMDLEFRAALDRVKKAMFDAIAHNII